jgi:hypothetical protein
MGLYFADQYSLLHASVGVITYFWNIPFIIALFLHFVFEFLENTKYGIYAINKYIIEPGFFHWPGGKHGSDSSLNILGDNVFFAIGWFLGYLTDYYGKIYELYGFTNK